MAAAYIEQLYEADASDVLETLHQPCLILHYRDDPAVPFSGSHQLAVGIPDAEFVPLDGPYHTPPSDHVDGIAEAICGFVGRRR